MNTSSSSGYRVARRRRSKPSGVVCECRSDGVSGGVDDMSGGEGVDGVIGKVDMGVIVLMWVWL